MSRMRTFFFFKSNRRISRNWFVFYFRMSVRGGPSCHWLWAPKKHRYATVCIYCP